MYVSMNSLRLTVQSPEHMTQIGVAIGGLAFPGCVILLTGELGAGKTVLAQGIAQGLDVKSRVTSPTFVIMQQYEGRLPLYHFDMYRLENVNADDIADLGFDEYIYANGVSVIEWPKIAPHKYLHIDIAYSDENCRELSFRMQGFAYLKIIEGLEKWKYDIINN